MINELQDSLFDSQPPTKSKEVCPLTDDESSFLDDNESQEIEEKIKNSQTPPKVNTAKGPNVTTSKFSLISPQSIILDNQETAKENKMIPEHLLIQEKHSNNEMIQEIALPLQRNELLKEQRKCMARTPSTNNTEQSDHSAKEGVVSSSKGDKEIISLSKEGSNYEGFDTLFDISHLKKITSKSYKDNSGWEIVKDMKKNVQKLRSTVIRSMNLDTIYKSSKDLKHKKFHEKIFSIRSRYYKTTIHKQLLKTPLREKSKCKKIGDITHKKTKKKQKTPDEIRKKMIDKNTSRKILWHPDHKYFDNLSGNTTKINKRSIDSKCLSIDELEVKRAGVEWEIKLEKENYSENIIIIEVSLLFAEGMSRKIFCYKGHSFPYLEDVLGLILMKKYDEKSSSNLQNKLDSKFLKDLLLAETTITQVHKTVNDNEKELDQENKRKNLENSHIVRLTDKCYYHFRQNKLSLSNFEKFIESYKGSIVKDLIQELFTVFFKQIVRFEEIGCDVKVYDESNELIITSIGYIKKNKSYVGIRKKLIKEIKILVDEMEKRSTVIKEKIKKKNKRQSLVYSKKFKFDDDLLPQPSIDHFENFKEKVKKKKSIVKKRVVTKKIVKKISFRDCEDDDDYRKKSEECRNFKKIKNISQNISSVQNINKSQSQKSNTRKRIKDKKKSPKNSPKFSLSNIVEENEVQHRMLNHKKLKSGQYKSPESSNRPTKISSSKQKVQENKDGVYSIPKKSTSRNVSPTHSTHSANQDSSIGNLLKANSVTLNPNQLKEVLEAVKEAFSEFGKYTISEIPSHSNSDKITLDQIYSIKILSSIAMLYKKKEIEITKRVTKIDNNKYQVEVIKISNENGEETQKDYKVETKTLGYSKFIQNYLILCIIMSPKRKLNSVIKWLMKRIPVIKAQLLALVDQKKVNDKVQKNINDRYKLFQSQKSGLNPIQKTKVARNKKEDKNMNTKFDQAKFYDKMIAIRQDNKEIESQKSLLSKVRLVQDKATKYSQGISKKNKRSKKSLKKKIPPKDRIIEGTKETLDPLEKPGPKRIRLEKRGPSQRIEIPSPSKRLNLGPSDSRGLVRNVVYTFEGDEDDGANQEIEDKKNSSQDDQVILLDSSESEMEENLPKDFILDDEQVIQEKSIQEEDFLDSKEDDLQENKESENIIDNDCNDDDNDDDSSSDIEFTIRKA